MDILCNSTNTVNQTCTIANRTVVLRSDFVYNATFNLVFDNTTFTCLNGSIPCSILINMTNNQSSRKNLTLRRGSQIQARQILILAVNSSVTLTENSTLNASGQSLFTAGTSSRTNFGASFVGEGGSCPDVIS